MPLKNRIEEDVDPDPFVVTATCLAAVGVALQFIQVFHQLGVNVDAASAEKDQLRTPLREMQKSIQEFEQHLSDLERSIIDGINSPEKEFFEKEFGINLACFSFKSTVHREYTRDLSGLMVRVSNFSLWANDIIGRYPNIAARIGKEMLEVVADADVRLNLLIRGGATNQQILSEVRTIVTTCKMSAGLILEGRRN